MEVPNEFEAFYDRVRWRLLRRYDEPPVRNPHLYFFNALSLKLLLQNEGFEVLGVTTERRNVQLDSRFPLGGFVKRFLYWLEARMRQGPNIVAVARKPVNMGEASRKAKPSAER
jgi:hypothetical protein